MKRLVSGLAISFALVTFGPACDSGEKKEDKKAGKADDKAAAKDGADKKAAGDDGGAAKEDAKPEPAKPVTLAAASLEEAGLEATVQAPEGAKVAEDFGAYTVKAGDSFQLEIHTGAADLAARKKEITDNTVNKLKSFVKESETELVYETEVVGNSEFHFVANKDLGDAKYNCEDTKGKSYTQADVEAMLAACHSLVASE